jgi:hypothetical protein
MKYLIFIFLLPFMAQAEDLEKLFQREYTYLVTQKNSYVTQQSLMKSKHQNRVKSLEFELGKMEKELAKLSVDNEISFQEVQKLESFARDDQNSANYLKRIYKTASELVSEVNSDLSFNSEKPTPPQVIEEPNIEHFQELSKDLTKVLYASTTQEEIKGVYRNLKGDLVEGKVKRFGKAGVTTETSEGVKPLGPSSEGVLAELEGKKFSTSALYLFEKITETAEAKKLPDWVDKMATAAPVLILSLMFFAVCGLFAALIRE